MAKIYFNDKIIKHLPETTILNYFIEDGPDGKSIFIRDTRPDVYENGRTFIMGDVNMYIKDGDYYIDILPMTVLDGTVLGMYVGEGYEFKSESDVEPIFVVAQKQADLTLGMSPTIEKQTVGGEVMMGMFHLGSKISFKRDNIAFQDVLTKDGWKRIKGPADSKLGIMTTAEAFFETTERRKREEEKIQNNKEEIKKNLYEAAKANEIPYYLAEEMADYVTGSKDRFFIFLASDIKLLKKKGLL
jgi:hypothetical protein